MSDRKKPIEFMANVPKNVKLMKFIKDGTNEYGNWYMWIVEEAGEEVPWFPPEAIHHQLSQIKPGTVLSVTKGEEKNQFTIKEPLFADTGEYKEPPPTDPGPTPWTTATIVVDSRAAELKGFWDLAYHLSRDVLSRFNADPMTPQGLKQEAADLQKVATTTFLTLVKK